MSHGSQPHKKRAASKSSSDVFVGLPTWSAISIIGAALITGFLITMLFGGILGTVYLAFFIAAGLGAALLVEPRGMFLTVSSLPIWFGVLTPLGAWILSQQAATSTPGFGTTDVLSALFPLAEFFPTLILVTLGSVLIAVIRLLLLRRGEKVREEQSLRARRRDREAERVSRTAATRARQQTAHVRTRRSLDDPQEGTEQVTVDELIRRSQERRQRTANQVGIHATEGPKRPPNRSRAEEPTEKQQPTERPAARPAPEPPRRHRRPSLGDDLYS